MTKDIAKDVAPEARKKAASDCLEHHISIHVSPNSDLGRLSFPSFFLLFNLVLLSLLDISVMLTNQILHHSQCSNRLLKGDNTSLWTPDNLLPQATTRTFFYIFLSPEIHLCSTNWTRGLSHFINRSTHCWKCVEFCWWEWMTGG